MLQKDATRRMPRFRQILSATVSFKILHGLRQAQIPQAFGSSDVGMLISLVSLVHIKAGTIALIPSYCRSFMRHSNSTSGQNTPSACVKYGLLPKDREKVSTWAA